MERGPNLLEGLAGLIGYWISGLSWPGYRLMTFAGRRDSDCLHWLGLLWTRAFNGLGSWLMRFNDRHFDRIIEWQNAQRKLP